MRIQITPDGYITQDSEAPIVGRSYYLEDATSGTTAQNKAFHALVAEYYKSGCHSKPNTSYDQFRDYIKRDLGAGFESYVFAYWDGKRAKIRKVKRFDMIPKSVVDDPEWSQSILGKLKSWGDYTKKERQSTMDKLIAEMHQAGVQTKKFHQILEGMER
jgi:hypothetical protein